MQKETRYDTGSVVPRFHGEDHRLKVAFLVIFEEDELNGLPQLIIRPAKERLSKAKASLEDDNAPELVENFRKEHEYLEAIRAILNICGKEKKDAAHDISSTLDRQQ